MERSVQTSDAHTGGIFRAVRCFGVWLYEHSGVDPQPIPEVETTESQQDTGKSRPEKTSEAQQQTESEERERAPVEQVNIAPVPMPWEQERDFSGKGRLPHSRM